MSSSKRASRRRRAASGCRQRGLFVRMVRDLAAPSFDRLARGLDQAAAMLDRWAAAVVAAQRERQAKFTPRRGSFLILPPGYRLEQLEPAAAQ